MSGEAQVGASVWAKPLCTVRGSLSVKPLAALPGISPQRGRAGAPGLTVAGPRVLRASQQGWGTGSRWSEEGAVPNWEPGSSGPVVTSMRTSGQSLPLSEPWRPPQPLFLPVISVRLRHLGWTRWSVFQELNPWFALCGVRPDNRHTKVCTPAPVHTITHTHVQPCAQTRMEQQR